MIALKRGRSKNLRQSRAQHEMITQRMCQDARCGSLGLFLRRRIRAIVDGKFARHVRKRSENRCQTDRFGHQNGPQIAPETLRGAVGALGRVSRRSRSAPGTLRGALETLRDAVQTRPGRPETLPGHFRDAPGGGRTLLERP